MLLTSNWKEEETKKQLEGEIEQIRETTKLDQILSDKYVKTVDHDQFYY